MMRLLFLFFPCLLFFSSEVLAAPAALPLPRFVSLKTDEVNVRTGPSLNYEIVFVYTHKGMPVEIVAEYDQWRKVRDIDGESGWIHRSMLSNKRMVTVLGDDILIMHKSSDPDADAIARLEPGVHAELLGCEVAKCRINAAGHRGWIGRELLWGVYPEETLD